MYSHWKLTAVEYVPCYMKNDTFGPYPSPLESFVPSHPI